jgi:crossover junction endodeoxyribonuclease RusA
MISIDLPWPPRELHPNARVHWGARARAAKKSRALSGFALLASGIRRNDPDIPEALKVTAVFFPPSRRGDEDNMLASCKAYLDGIADALGVDDSGFKIVIRREEPRKGGLVRIELEAAA